MATCSHGSVQDTWAAFGRLCLLGSSDSSISPSATLFSVCFLTCLRLLDCGRKSFSNPLKAVTKQPSGEMSGELGLQTPELVVVSVFCSPALHPALGLLDGGETVVFLE